LGAGKLVRVALVLIIADHPAMCKLCGFADHSHDATPCTKCEVSHDEFFTEVSLRNGKAI
jgi:predicted Zn-ribbon and HTH transcriptional regulator